MDSHILGQTYTIAAPYANRAKANYGAKNCCGPMPTDIRIPGFLNMTTRQARSSRIGSQQRLIKKGPEQQLGFSS
jgi:hypothetical protein